MYEHSVSVREIRVPGTWSHVVPEPYATDSPRIGTRTPNVCTRIVLRPRGRCCTRQPLLFFPRIVSRCRRSITQIYEKSVGFGGGLGAPVGGLYPDFVVFLGLSLTTSPGPVLSLTQTSYDVCAVRSGVLRRARRKI